MLTFPALFTLLFPSLAHTAIYVLLLSLQTLFYTMSLCVDFGWYQEAWKQQRLATSSFARVRIAQLDAKVDTERLVHCRSLSGRFLRP